MRDTTRIDIDLVAVDNKASAALKLTETQFVNINIQIAKAQKQAAMLSNAFKQFQLIGKLTETATNAAKQQGDLDIFRQAKKNVATASMLSNPQWESTRSQALMMAHQKKEWEKQEKMRLGLTPLKPPTLVFGEAGYKEQRKAELSLQHQKSLLDQNLKSQLGMRDAAGGFAKNLGKSLLSFVAIRQSMKFFSNVLKESASWTENLNLFEVTFGKASSGALDFALNVQKAYGIGANEIIRYTGLFKQMSEAIGIAELTSTEMSTTLTTLGYDIASLYNISTESAMEKLRAGLAGQTKPLRSLGMDITAQSLDKYLGSMGLDYTSKMLNQADKMLLRTILIVDQAKNSYGDMAKTINTFANQMKVFSGSFENFKLAVGDLIIQPATVAITAVNGFVIAMTNIIRTFVPLSKDSGLNQTADSIGAVDEATQDLEKTMGLLSFDKFESLSKGDGASGINGMLTDEFAKKQAQYMAKFSEQMALIENNANDIAKAIQGWIFPNGLNTEGKNFLDILNQVNPLVTAIVGVISLLIGVTVINGIIKLGKSIATALISPIGIVIGGVMLLVYNISNLISSWNDMSNWERAVGIIGAVAGAILLVVGAIAAFHSAWSVGTAAIAITAGIIAVGATIAAFSMANKRQAEEMARISIPTYAQGGLPDKGQMFIANERGPELVANIGGGQTGVANENFMFQFADRINAKTNEQIAVLQQQNSILLDILGKSSDIVLDGNTLGRVSYPYTKKEGVRRGDWRK